MYLFWGQSMGSKQKKVVSKNNSCYVLITCGEPSQDGQMEVEMTIGGDPVLAAYLVESAHSLIDRPHDNAF